MNLRLLDHENVGLLHSSAGDNAGLGGKQGLCHRPRPKSNKQSGCHTPGRKIVGKRMMFYPMLA